MKSTAATPLQPSQGAVVIEFPRRRIAEPSVAELSIAALLVEAYAKMRAATSDWQKQRVLAHADGLATALAITMAGECGDEEFLMKVALVSALNDGCDDPEALVNAARNPEDDDVA